jgi:hypothetical protein
MVQRHFARSQDDVDRLALVDLDLDFLAHDGLPAATIHH